MFTQSITALTTSILFSFSAAIPVFAAEITPQIAHTMTKLDGTSWKLIGFGQSEPLKSLLKETEITLEFLNNRVAGTGGCNRYMGGYKQENHQLTFPPLASTQKACLPDIMKQEFQYFQLLQQTQTVEINAQGQLELRSPQGILVFESPAEMDSEKSWLDPEKPQNWNQAGASIPKAPIIEGGGNLAQCQEVGRKPSNSVDQALLQAGWTLFGAIQVYGNTSVRSAMANADGMCRPFAYQTFVFVEDQFAGTLSPSVMDARTEGSLKQAYLSGETSLFAEFNRYDEKDALCCPSRTSNVSYTIEQQKGLPIIIPNQISTSTP